MPEFRPGKLLTLAMTAMLAVAGCRESGGEGEYFAISGKLFEFNYRLGIATYVVTLNPLQPIPDGMVAVVNFQDPAGGDPIEVRQRMWPKLRHRPSPARRFPASPRTSPTLWKSGSRTRTVI